MPSAVVTHLASQVGVPAEACVAYDWRGRTIKYDRVQIRSALGFRETSVEDADKLVDWLANEIVPHERALDRVRAAVYTRRRELRLEPPTTERIERLVRLALANHEQQVSTAVRVRLSTKSVEALDGLLLTPTKSSLADGELTRAPVVELKTDPGPAGLESVLAEITKLQRLRAIGLPPDLFADVASKARQRVQIEEPYELRRHPEPVRSTLLAAWAGLRSGELGAAAANSAPAVAGWLADYRGCWMAFVTADSVLVTAQPDGVGNTTATRGSMNVADHAGSTPRAVAQ